MATVLKQVDVSLTQHPRLHPAKRSPDDIDAMGSEHFTNAELRQFRRDDAQAGTIVARTLCAMFAWSVFIVSIVIWWTFRTV